MQNDDYNTYRRFSEEREKETKPHTRDSRVRLLDFLAQIFPDKHHHKAQKKPKRTATAKTKTKKPSKNQECKCVIARFFGDEKAKNMNCVVDNQSKDKCLPMTKELYKSLPMSSLKAIASYMKLDKDDYAKMKKTDLIPFVIQYIPRDFRSFSRKEFT